MLAETKTKVAELRENATRHALELQAQARKELEEVREIAAKVRAEAEAEVAWQRTEAKTQADDRVQDAKEEAIKIVVEAEEVRRSTLGRLEAQRAEINQDTQRLATRRDTILNELDQIATTIEHLTNQSRASVAAGLFNPQ
jgi:hypothetical protein